MEQKKRKKKMSIAMIVLVVVILVAGCGVYAYVNRPQEIVPIDAEERPPQPEETTEYVYELYED